MNSSRAKRFLLALLTQAMLCLTFAPVIAAAQADCARAAKDDDRPNRGGATILAARDAANVRPEEMSDAERRAPSRRGSPDRGPSHRRDHHRDATTIDALLTTDSGAQPAAHSVDGLAGDLFIDSTWPTSIDFAPCFTGLAFDRARGLFSKSVSASLQPTGPPTR